MRLLSVAEENELNALLVELKQTCAQPGAALQAEASTHTRSASEQAKHLATEGAITALVERVRQLQQTVSQAASLSTGTDQAPSSQGGKSHSFSARSFKPFNTACATRTPVTWLAGQVPSGDSQVGLHREMTASTTERVKGHSSGPMIAHSAPSSSAFQETFRKPGGNPSVA